MNNTKIQKRNTKGHFLYNDGIKYRQSDLDIAVSVAVRDALIKHDNVSRETYNRIDVATHAFKAGLNASGFWQSPSQKLATYLRDNNIT